MARKTNLERLNEVVETIRLNDGLVRANDIAHQLNLHPQAVTRLLSVVDTETDELLTESNKGFLGIFKK